MKKELQDAAISLKASQEQEQQLQQEVTEWTKKATELAQTSQKLQEKIEEGTLSTKAALLAEEKARVELEVKENMNVLLESERATLEQQLCTALEQYSQFKKKIAAVLARDEMPSQSFPAATANATARTTSYPPASRMKEDEEESGNVDTVVDEAFESPSNLKVDVAMPPDAPRGDKSRKMKTTSPPTASPNDDRVMPSDAAIAIET